MTVRVQFHEAQELLRVDVHSLGLLAERAVIGAMSALLGDDAEAAGRVLAGDDQIDALFVALEERAYALVAQQAPVATDLRFLMSALRVMADFEKTGDRAVAVAKTSLAEWEREPVTICLLGRMGDLALRMLSAARDAWMNQDLFVASDLQRRDDVLDRTFRELVAHLLAQQGPGAPSLVLHAHAAGRNLERIADHSVIIGERVSYLLTGDPSALAAEIG
ncbi:MAG TPA: phosphate signaling complex protein PhoU [Acidimicrobiales bacterium]|nr:phosphate signaling complex protein PhoU [Acidimicrobiales bacterium]